MMPFIISTKKFGNESFSNQIQAKKFVLENINRAIWLSNKERLFVELWMSGRLYPKDLKQFLDLEKIQKDANIEYFVDHPEKDNREYAFLLFEAFVDAEIYKLRREILTKLSYTFHHNVLTMIENTFPLL